MGAPESVLLFAYGTLQDAETQLDVLGRIADDGTDVLTGWRVGTAARRDRRDANPQGVMAVRVAHRTDDPHDKVVGTLLRLTLEELEAVDEYQAPSHHRERIRLASGRDAWVYLP